MNKRPKLRTVQKVQPPYPLNEFPAGFAHKLGEEVTYILAMSSEGRKPTIEGKDWECIFAKCIGAEWDPSNVGLDDVKLYPCAWSAKSVKYKNPYAQKKVRLISGRCSPIFSYDAENISPSKSDPVELGKMVLGIWNERASAIYKQFPILRTVVLIRSEDLTSLVVFEFDTIRYEPSDYHWKWNKRGNLEGYDKRSDYHKFTWQPHGSQLTIVHKVPDNRLKIRLRKPPTLPMYGVLNVIGFAPHWVEIVP